jgi:DNA-binding LacI/PurR family transcriptional regulator
MAKSNKRFTIYDVAQVAGVSHQTVSRVINNSPNVSEDTRTRVLNVIAELNYRPNKAAQALNTQRTNILEVITLDVYTVPAAVIDTMSRVAKELGYKMIVSVINEDLLEDTVNEALGRLVDGFIFTTSRPGTDYDNLKNLCKTTPFVRVVAEYGVSVPSVLYDQRHGEAQAVRHLIELGHTEIAEIRGPSNNLDAVARHNGLIATMQENGLELVTQATGNFSVASGYEAAQVLFEVGKSFTAIAAANDEMAIGAMAYLKELGLRVPDDISIVGFDDHPFAPFADPPLTTMRQDWPLMAKIATEYLVDLIEKADMPRYQHVLIPELIIRKSTRRRS